MPQSRIERLSDDYKSTVLPLYYKGIWFRVEELNLSVELMRLESSHCFNPVCLELYDGFEPTSSAWKAEVLPLYEYSILAGKTGFEPAIFSVTGRHVRPLHHMPMFGRSGGD